MDEAEVLELISPMLKGSTITEVEDFGDAFAIHFVNDEYFLSGKIEDMEIGAGPIIYVKSTREIFQTGSGQDAEQYIQAYRECGDVYGQLSERLEIEALPNESDRKQAILNLKKVLDINLSDAKKLAEEILNVGRAEVALTHEWEAKEARDKLTSVGFMVKQLWNRSC